MFRFLRGTRYFSLIAVIGSLIAALGMFISGAQGIVTALAAMGSHSDGSLEVLLIEGMDEFLVAVGFLVFALGLYELFIEPLGLPRALTYQSLHELKDSLANIIILAMVVTFLQKLEQLGNGLEILHYALAVALISGILIAFKVAVRGQQAPTQNSKEPL
jgi:uncharacterized membrane protein YqhA